MYDSHADTMEHIEKVNDYLHEIIFKLIQRGRNHDQSKLREPEKSIFDEWTPKLSGVTYGSQEYRGMLDAMKPAIDHHQKNNRHHPEFHRNGIHDMDLIDLVEMICDWKAATMRHDDGDIQKSLLINKDRHKIPDPIFTLLRKTVANMDW